MMRENKTYTVKKVNQLNLDQLRERLTNLKHQKDSAHYKHLTKRLKTLNQ